MSAALERLNGGHAPNVLFKDYRRNSQSTLPDGEVAAWQDIIGSGRFTGLKCLWPAHRRREGQIAKAHGLRVLFRAPGEGNVHFEDVLTMLTELGGNSESERVVDEIELGNEPDTDPRSLWNHCVYLELCHLHCAKIAADKGISLMTPGWRDGLHLPTAAELTPQVQAQQPDWTAAQCKDNATRLAARLREVYGLYRNHALHVYDPHRLVATWRRNGGQKPPNFPPDAIDKINLWFSDLSKLGGVPSQEQPSRRYSVTEYGIAARLLSGYTDKSKSDIEKAGRYAEFLGALALYSPFVSSAYMFIVGGTDGFDRFNNPGVYDPNGSSSYWLDQAALAELGRRVYF